MILKLTQCFQLHRIHCRRQKGVSKLKRIHSLQREHCQFLVKTKAYLESEGTWDGMMIRPIDVNVVYTFTIGIDTGRSGGRAANTAVST